MPSLDDCMHTNKKLMDTNQQLLHKKHTWKQTAIVLVVILFLLFVTQGVFGLFSHFNDMISWTHHSIHDPSFEGHYFFETGKYYKDELQIHKSGRISMIGIHRSMSHKGSGTLPVAWKNKHEGRVFLWHDSTPFIVRLKNGPPRVEIMEDHNGSPLHDNWPKTYLLLKSF